MPKETNPELRDLSTHQAGAADLHETRKADRSVTIEPAGAPGIVGDADRDASDAARH